MDNHDQKRRDHAARVLADGFVIISMILKKLDGILLAPKADGSARENIAEAFIIVRRDILPTVEAPPEVLALVGFLLLDWVTLSDLVTLAQATGYTPRRLDTIEEVATRLQLGMGAAGDFGLARE